MNSFFRGDSVLSWDKSSASDNVDRLHSSPLSKVQHHPPTAPNSLVSIFATAFLGGTFPETHGRILSQTLNEKAVEGDGYDVVEPCTACSTPKWDHKMQLWVIFLNLILTCRK